MNRPLPAQVRTIEIRNPGSRPEHVVSSSGVPSWSSKPWVYGFAFQGEHAEDALVDAPQWFAADESLQRLDAQRKLAQGEGALGSHAAAAEPGQVRLGGVLRAIDDPQ